MRHVFWITLGIFLTGTALRADTLKLRDGKTVDGKVLAMNDQGVRFETTSGEIHFYKDSEIASIQKGAAVPAQAARAATSAATPTPTVPAGSVTIPAGTVLTVKFDDDVTSKMPKGQRFTTSLETNITVDGAVAVPAETKVYGVISDSKQQGMVGQSGIAVTLTGFNIGGNIVPIKCEILAGTGDRKARQGARGAAAGAAIGAAAGGGGGAAKGAMIGAAASTLRRQTVGVKAGTIQDFKLAEPVTVVR